MEGCKRVAKIRQAGAQAKIINEMRCGRPITTTAQTLLVRIDGIGESCTMINNRATGGLDDDQNNAICSGWKRLNITQSGRDTCSRNVCRTAPPFTPSYSPVLPTQIPHNAKNQMTLLTVAFGVVRLLELNTDCSVGDYVVSEDVVAGAPVGRFRWVGALVSVQTVCAERKNKEPGQERSKQPLAMAQNYDDQNWEWIAQQGFLLRTTYPMRGLKNAGAEREVTVVILKRGGQIGVKVHDTSGCEVKRRDVYDKTVRGLHTSATKTTLSAPHFCSYYPKPTAGEFWIITYMLSRYP